MATIVDSATAAISGQETKGWRELGQAKRDEILNSIPSKWRLKSDQLPSNEEQRDVTEYVRQFFTDRENEITETDVVGIAEKVAGGEWSAVEVTEAFCHRAAVAHQLTNCLHEFFYEAAIEDAKALDSYFATHKKTKGLLHGVPISLKDQFHVKGVETTMGYIGWINTFQGMENDPRYKTYESELVRELRELGAVLYCKTSVPHSLMSGETVNNIIGFTWNPKNRLLSSGGSSGGEGALIGLRGSPGGFGTDIGGSVRIPAAFNGLWGIRPSAGRMPYEGAPNSMDGQNSVLSVVGPLATTARSVKYLFQAILSQKPWLYDPTAIKMPWNKQEEDAAATQAAARSRLKTTTNPLTFAIMRTDGIVNPHPPILRALDTVSKLLQNQGHKVIPFDLYPSPSSSTSEPTPESKQKYTTQDHGQGLTIVANSWLFDAGQDIHKSLALGSEPISTQVAQLYGQTQKDSGLIEYTATQIAQNNIHQREWKKKWLDTVVHDLRADIVITPLAPFASSRPGHYRYYGYSMFVNGLDLSSIVVPVTNVDRNLDTWSNVVLPTAYSNEEEGQRGEYKALSDLDQAVHDSYDPEIYHGAHVAVQFIGGRYEEEKVMGVAEYVGDLIGNN